MAIHKSTMVSKHDPFFAYKKAICPICFCPFCPAIVIPFCNTLKNKTLQESKDFTGQIGQKQIGQIHFVGKKIDRKFGCVVEKHYFFDKIGYVSSVSYSTSWCSLKGFLRVEAIHLMLRNENLFSFPLLNRFFTLSLRR